VVSFMDYWTVWTVVIICFYGLYGHYGLFGQCLTFSFDEWTMVLLYAVVMWYLVQYMFVSYCDIIL
jgi:hypothetical protein